MSHTKETAINFGLVLGSILVGLLFCEFILFRFVLAASDVPINAFVNGLVRYAPQQYGIWRVRNEIAAPYAINKQGWNSGVGDYSITRKPGIMRVALIGDSMVEALQVAHNRSIGEGLSAKMSRDGRAVEVYRFAISGAPMSQYLYMMECEITAYQPDWIVVILIHNDFDESFRFVQGRYTSSFLKLKLAGGKVVTEIPPVPWRPGAADWLRRTATARYMHYRWQVKIGAIRDLVLGPAQAASERDEANINVDAVLRRLPEVAVATDYMFTRMAAVARTSGTKLLLAMDGVRGAIYSDSENVSQALILNRLSADLARKHDIPFVDLHQAFRADWSANRRRFDFDSDGHWNEHGHAVAADAVARVIGVQEAATRQF